MGNGLGGGLGKGCDGGGTIAFAVFLILILLLFSSDIC